MWDQTLRLFTVIDTTQKACHDLIDMIKNHCGGNSPQLMLNGKPLHLK